MVEELSCLFDMGWRQIAVESGTMYDAHHDAYTSDDDGDGFWISWRL
jgi:hypothetical protein